MRVILLLAGLISSISIFAEDVDIRNEYGQIKSLNPYAIANNGKEHTHFYRYKDCSFEIKHIHDRKKNSPRYHRHFLPHADACQLRHHQKKHNTSGTAKVKKIQKKLKSLGFYLGSINGKLNAETKNAIQMLIVSHELVTKKN